MEGDSIEEVSKKIGINRHTVRTLKLRFKSEGIGCILKDRERQGRPKRITEEQEQKIIELTTNSKPDNATYWSRSLMAKKTGLSDSTIARIWKKYGLKTHLQETFNVSNDPKF